MRAEGNGSSGERGLRGPGAEGNGVRWVGKLRSLFIYLFIYLFYFFIIILFIYLFIYFIYFYLLFIFFFGEHVYASTSNFFLYLG